jgi:hypothetical protein
MIRQDGGDVAHEPLEAQTRDRRDGVKRQSLRRAEAFELARRSSVPESSALLPATI